jgi:hypothetical protein
LVLSLSRPQQLQLSSDANEKRERHQNDTGFNSAAVLAHLVRVPLGPILRSVFLRGIAAFYLSHLLPSPSLKPLMPRFLTPSLFRSFACFFFSLSFPSVQFSLFSTLSSVRPSVRRPSSVDGAAVVVHAALQPLAALAALAIASFALALPSSSLWQWQSLASSQSASLFLPSAATQCACLPSPTPSPSPLPGCPACLPEASAALPCCPSRRVQRCLAQSTHHGRQHLQQQRRRRCRPRHIRERKNQANPGTAS